MPDPHPGLKVLSLKQQANGAHSMLDSCTLGRRGSLGATSLGRSAFDKCSHITLYNHCWSTSFPRQRPGSFDCQGYKGKAAQVKRVVHRAAIVSVLSFCAGGSSATVAMDATGGVIVSNMHRGRRL